MSPGQPTQLEVVQHVRNVRNVHCVANEVFELVLAVRVLAQVVHDALNVVAKGFFFLF